MSDRRRTFTEPQAGSLGPDWLSRQIVPDLYPRKSDPFRPAGAVPPETAPWGGVGAEETSEFYAQLTTPGGRPFVTQRALNYSITAGVAPVPLMNQDAYCDAFVVDVYSSAANSVFLGFGQGVTVLSGIEVRVGLPLMLSTDNTREQWELQRALDFMAAALALQAGLPPQGTYRAPRVVYNARDWFVVAAAPTAVSVQLFYVPELQ